MATDQTVLRCVGAADAHIRALIAHAKTIDEGKITYQRERKFDEDVLQISYDENISKRLIESVIRVFAEGLTDCLYAMDDIPLEEQLVTLLKLRGKTLSVAESFTGGGVGKRIVSVSWEELQLF